MLRGLSPGPNYDQLPVNRPIRSATPFGAQIILNGHEYVVCQAQAAGINFVKEGNCFTAVADPAGLAQIAETLSQHAAIGAAEPGLRPVDLHRVPVLWPGHHRAELQRVLLRLLGLSSRVQP
jgi:hypothetical protein